jgi:hypothetical protein
VGKPRVHLSLDVASIVNKMPLHSSCTPWLPTPSTLQNYTKVLILLMVKSSSASPACVLGLVGAPAAEVFSLALDHVRLSCSFPFRLRVHRPPPFLVMSLSFCQSTTFIDPPTPFLQIVCEHDGEEKANN